MITIQVTQEHIDKGIPGKADGGPVYWAACAAGLDVESVDADGIVWYSNDGVEKYFWTFPDDISERIIRYDDNQGMTPFELTLEEPLGPMVLEYSEGGEMTTENDSRIDQLNQQWAESYAELEAINEELLAALQFCVNVMREQGLWQQVEQKAVNNAEAVMLKARGES